MLLNETENKNFEKIKDFHKNIINKKKTTYFINSQTIEIKSEISMRFCVKDNDDYERQFTKIIIKKQDKWKEIILHAYLNGNFVGK